MELLRQNRCPRVVLLVRMGRAWFRVRWRDGQQQWRVIRDDAARQAVGRG